MSDSTVNLFNSDKSFFYEKKFKEERITAIALPLIGIALAGIGLILMGIGTNPSTMHIGYGIFPYLCGSQLFLLGIFTAVLGVVPLSMSIYHLAKWKKITQPIN